MLLSNGYKHPENRLKKFEVSLKITSTNLAKKLPSQALSQTASHRVLQFLSQTAHVRFHRRKRVHHSPFEERSHTAAHTPKQGAFRMGRYHYPRSVPHVHEHPRAGYQNGKLCRFWVLVGDAPEERRKPSEQRCAYVRRCSEASQPHWAV